MVLAQTIQIHEILLVVVYLCLIGYLGWLGYRKTQNAKDYLVAGGQTHPFIMAMSYGATFISTSAIVGFGGVAGMFGMSLMWLVFLNIFVGIFIAFVFLGGRTRRMGHHLGAHTFPELLGKRYQSKGIQVLAGMIIFLFIPLYAAATLIGGCKFLEAHFNMDYSVALLAFGAIVAVYVVMGGLKGIMYAEAMQGTIMFFSMLILLLFTYWAVGGVGEGHRYLTGMADLVPENLKAIGHRGWTAFPEAGFGDAKYNLWWVTVSTIILGVGIGVLAQPQLVVRFMTVKSQKELNRATLLGSLFILVIPGTAYVVGSLSNAYFAKNGDILTGRVVKVTNEERGYVVCQLMEKSGDNVWQDVKNDKGKPRQVPLVLDAKQPYLQDKVSLDGQEYPIAQGRSISIGYAGQTDKIMPVFVSKAMPRWFGLLFMLTLLAAAMSTLSGQFHVLGSSVSRDVYEQVTNRGGGGIGIARLGIIFGVILAVTIGHYAPGNFIARATAIFFGICASAFLPAFVGGLFFRGVTGPAAKASMAVGFAVTAFWLLFIKAKEAGAIGLVQKITGGKPSILADYPNWPVVDPIVIALPLSILTLVIVSMLTQKPDRQHLDKCFAK